MKFQLLLGTLLLAAGGTALSPVNAQPLPDQDSWGATLDEAFYDSGNVYDTQTTVGNLRTMFGTGAGLFRRGNYPEIAIERDSWEVEKVYRTMLQDQVASDPEIRVIDLPNPFESSLLVEPSIFSRQANGTEFVDERSAF